MARYWDGADPVGSRIKFDTETWYTVVGVAGNVRQYGLNREGDRAGLCAARCKRHRRLQARCWCGQPAIRRHSPSAVRDAVHSLDPDLPVENMKTLEDLRSGFLATPRLTAVLLMLFAALALIVTLAGLTGRHRNVGLAAHAGVRDQARAWRDARWRPVRRPPPGPAPGGSRPRRRHRGFSVRRSNPDRLLVRYRAERSVDARRRWRSRSSSRAPLPAWARRVGRRAWIRCWR